MRMLMIWEFVNEIVHTDSEDNIDWDLSSDNKHNKDIEGNSNSDGGDGNDSDEAEDNIPDERGLPKLVPWDRPINREHEYDHTPENIVNGCIGEEELHPHRKFPKLCSGKVVLRYSCCQNGSCSM
ncbi:hypothetical protein SARC_06692 [Sphaeroforma arctica JP610]|uniref:Uncharacterized protein n=1 Tax=Sphaeroforma arctica JP610 TaxID=667725 RepID=A0A0L0FVT5_9EUKA|nr:hypothetical protein SARC_06692 [Sphaeroforma arctica JP610]KNC80960.1 hypothetical protein SARC_06692 [Sphaeroforma arctica JP610]|eukprot:XP_014154862.1 hypothetical protein SARC_06692 [Sphaeroforma arctica JP610]